jgi:hypothetical protein
MKAVTKSIYIAIVLSQLFRYNLHHILKIFIIREKDMSIEFGALTEQRRSNAEQCPFLIDEDNVMKIRRRREIIIIICRDHLVYKLAITIGLNLKKLNGFQAGLRWYCLQFLFFWLQNARYARN